MKDTELRELFGKLERMIAAATSSIIGGKTSIEERLTRLQELAEMGRRFPSIELPSSRIPLYVGFVVGVIVFLGGVFLGYLIGAH